jgi:hypothetical protein
VLQAAELLQGAVVAVINIKKRQLNCTRKKPNALSLLTTSALAIPGMVHATAVPEKQTLSIRYTQYQEAPIAADKVSLGNTGRYSIDVLQMGFFTPVKDKYSVDSNVTFETLSGASPYSSTDDGNGQTQVFMSGASIEEKRLDASVNGTRYFKEGTISASVSVSAENDYQSVGIGTGGTIELNDKHTTLLASISTSFDTLSPTDAELFGGGRLAADGKTKRSFSIYEGVTQVLNRHQTLQVGIGYTRMTGYLSDPYRIKDLRPDSREQHTLSAQYRHHLPQYRNISWHLDYRFYQDDWGVNANTIGTSIWKDVSFEGLKFTLAPNLRYHWQHSADFYTLEADPTSEPFYSDDFRLSAYGAITLGIDIQYHANDFSVTMGLSQYLSDESWGLTGKENTDTPALVEFTTFSLGLDYHF